LLTHWLNRAGPMKNMYGLKHVNTVTKAANELCKSDLVCVYTGVTLQIRNA